MRISGQGAAAQSYAASAPKKLQAQPVVRSETKLELEPSDGFASTQLPAGVGGNLNITA